MAQGDEGCIVRGDHCWEPRCQCPERVLISPMGVDDIRSAPPKGGRYELALVFVRVAGRSS
jgi:hypothetical protein